MEIPKEQRNKMVAGLKHTHNYIKSNYLKRTDVVVIKLGQLTIDKIRPVREDLSNKRNNNNNKLGPFQSHLENT
jgi:hypothetical protein